MPQCGSGLHVVADPGLDPHHLTRIGRRDRDFPPGRHRHCGAGLERFGLRDLDGGEGYTQRSLLLGIEGYVAVGRCSLSVDRDCNQQDSPHDYDRGVASAPILNDLASVDRQPGIQMRHDVEDAMSRHRSLRRVNGDLMTLCNGQVRIDAEMHVNLNQIAHFASS